MQSATIVLAVLLTLGPALAADLPREVAAFVARRDRCDHFRGEDPADPVRSAQIARALEVNCRGTDAELARLKRRHGGDPAIRARLGRYDPQVE
ncbi:hypothetical protein D9599_25555 [Roseomonas sp. KE2513]|uniref:hypothetical protein n=1 Tax=Roseomonas sp. KE2513 TaxID=2479202 RepID=UPI0018E03F39|nr:hypothetical protein [Roseomonas sp. KE2513]MBI0538923.1 hypothetical protein [Roseomonas sp. KE2513]